MNTKFKRTISIFLCTLMVAGALPIFTVPGIATGETKTVYISDGGTGDGSSAASPLGAINTAIAAINTAVAADPNITAGKIILAGNVTTTTSYTETTHSVPITYTSADKANYKLILGNNFSLRGAAYFTGLEIYINRTTETSIYAYGNTLVMGEEGVANDIIVGGVGSQRLSVVGGGNNSTVGQINVEVNSGTYTYFRIGSGASGGTVTGDANWVVNGGTILSTVSLGGVSASNTIQGKTNVTINGGALSGNIYLGCCGTGNTSTFGDVATLKINGGTFSGMITPYTSGGTIVFSEGCVIDISVYTGNSDLDSKINTSGDCANSYRIIDIDPQYALHNVTIRGQQLSRYMVIADSMANNAALVLQDALEANTGYTIDLGLEEDLYKYDSRYIYLMTLPINGKSFDLESDEALFYEEDGNFYIILGSRDIVEAQAVDYFLTEVLCLNDDYTASVASGDIDLTDYEQIITLTADAELSAVSGQADTLRTGIVGSGNHYSAADVTGSGVCYYVSNCGNDANDGLSPTTAWLTLSKVSGYTFPAGSVVLFERGGLWRGQLILKSNVIYTSYGQGEKPKIYGSTRDAAQVGSWSATATASVWVYSYTYTLDVGNLIFNNGEAYGYKEIPTVDNFTGSINELTANYHFWHDSSTGQVYLYYNGGNPGNEFDSIELALKSNIIYANGVSNVVFDNFCLKYGGAHGVSAVNVTNIDVI